MQNRTILLCDDNLVNRKLVSAMLHGHAYNIIETDCGHACINKALQHAEEIDLVLLDISLKDISGIEVCHAIRSSSMANAQSLPIIAYTAHALEDEHKSYISNGFSDVLTKPVVRDVLFSMLAKHLG